MRLKNASAILVIFAVTFAVTGVMAQSLPPVTTPGGTPRSMQRRMMAGRTRTSSTGGGVPEAQTIATIHQRMEEMQSTLDKMHAVLKQMNAKAAKSSAKDPMTKANLDMWSLLVGHLDKQFVDLKAAAATREGMEARRAEMLKRMQARTGAGAQVQSVSPTPDATPAEGATPPAQVTPAQTGAPGISPAAPSQPAPAQPANATPSPN